MEVIATTMTPVERMCTVVLDEMAIKKQFYYDRTNDAICGVSGSGAAAKQAMVVMARGILGKWKQASHTLEKTFVLILLCIFKRIYLNHVFQQTIGYLFSPSSMPAEEIAAIIKDAIRHLHHNRADSM